MRWEGHTLLMTDEFFAPELVHLLVLIPKGNYKTTWEAALADWHLLTVPAPRAFCAAADKGQAKELYDFAAHFATARPWLEDRLAVKSSTLEIRHASAPGRSALKVLAQDDSKQGGKKQGLNSTLSLADELHAWANRNLFVDMRSGGFKRRNSARIAGDPLWWTLGKMATITTEGYDSESVLAEELTKFLGDPEKGIAPKGTVETDMRVLDDGSVVHDPENGRLTIARYGDGRNVLLRWACRESDDPEDDEATKLANPASSATVESIGDARESLTPWEFDRYRRNVRTLGFKSWIPTDAWPALRSADVPRVEWRTWEGATTTGERDNEGNVLLRDVRDKDDEIVTAALTEEFRAYVRALYPPGTSIVGAVDMARYRDTAAVVVIGRDEKGRKVPRTIVWRSGGKNSPIRYEWPKAAILALHDTYNLAACGFDPKYFDQSAEELADLGVAMETFPQSPERMGPADTELRREILAEVPEFVHDGDPTLTAHIRAGKTKDVGPKVFMIVQQDGASPPPIDACKALSMANAIDKMELAAEWGVIF